MLVNFISPFGQSLARDFRGEIGEWPIQALLRFRRAAHQIELRASGIEESRDKYLTQCLLTPFGIQEWKRLLMLFVNGSEHVFARRVYSSLRI